MTNASQITEFLKANKIKFNVWNNKRIYINGVDIEADRYKTGNISTPYLYWKENSYTFSSNKKALAALASLGSLGSCQDVFFDIEKSQWINSDKITDKLKNFETGLGSDLKNCFSQLLSD